LKYIHELFDGLVQSTPTSPFLICPDRTWSFADLAQLVDTLEAELLSLQVRRGDRVMALAENCPEHTALVLACSRIGAWTCGINARMSRGEVAAFCKMPRA
jgi:malonyl-CoA/methylmalonyl-CoA synthetase